MWTISNRKQIAFVIITYITNAYISNKASYPTVAYWPRHSECCNQNLGCLVLSWFLGASKGYMIEIDRPCQTSPLYEEHNIKYVAMGQCKFLLGLWRIHMDLPWMWNGVFLQWLSPLHHFVRDNDIPIIILCYVAWSKI